MGEEVSSEGSWSVFFFINDDKSPVAGLWIGGVDCRAQKDRHQASRRTCHVLLDILFTPCPIIATSNQMPSNSARSYVCGSHSARGALNRA